MDERARSMRGRARSYLLVPAGGEGEGLGHLLRCVRLSARLGAGVSFFVRHLDDAAKVVLAQRVALLPARSRPAMLSRLPRGSRWDVVAVDARGISAEELGELMPHGLVVGLDEGGDARGFAPFLVDTLPGPPRRAVANLSDPSYLFLPPQKRRQPPRSIRRILLSLGGEDREHLGEKLAEVMIRDGVADAGQLTVVQGPLSGSRTWPSGVAMGVATGPDGISPLLSSHDVLITHFGMAAFEALATGIPAILFNPTAYHAELGQAAGFPQIGVGTPDTARLKKLLADPAGLYQQPRSFNRAIGRDRGKRLPELLRTLSLIGSSDCPVCGAAGNRVIGRFPDRTYRVCRGCGITYLESYAGRRREYSDRYFLADYKAQYGRTYLEDFSSIKAACEPRVSILLELLGERGAAGTVVDVGCAYGPFLAALKDRGSAGFGLDVS
ncbi:MAG TPA: hypothetical protein VL359_07975, partial [bacterium]|nr:hypothetical protein [bacterium]